MQQHTGKRISDRPVDEHATAGVTYPMVRACVACYLLAMRLCHSGKAVHRVFASCGQEAFLEDHVHARSACRAASRRPPPWPNC